MDNIEIKAVTQGRGRICVDLLRSLPLWFPSDLAVKQYAAEVEAMATFAAYEGEKAVGFVSLTRGNAWTGGVHVLAVHPSFQRRGLGRRLVETAGNYLKEFNYEFLSLKTLPPSRPGKENEITRKFCQAVGFRPVEEFKAAAGDAEPFLLMIKAL